MAEQTFKCPNCGFEIPVTEAVTGQIEKDAKAQYEAKLAAERKADRERLDKERKALENEREAIEEAARKKEGEKLALEMKDLQAELKEKGDRLLGHGFFIVLGTGARASAEPDRTLARPQRPDRPAGQEGAIV